MIMLRSWASNKAVDQKKEDLISLLNLYKTGLQKAKQIIMEKGNLLIPFCAHWCKLVVLSRYAQS